MKSIGDDPFFRYGSSKYDLQDTSTPHWYVGLSDGIGTVRYKAMPNDRNDKELHETTVLELFTRMYCHTKWSTDNTGYSIEGRDGDGSQRHDFTIKLDYDRSTLAIEITTLGDGRDTHVAHALRDASIKIARKYPGQYFVFLTRNMRAYDLKQMFRDAQRLDAINAPDPEDERLFTFIEELKASNKPYIRRLKGGTTQIHTTGDKTLSLREAIQNAISEKENKDYTPYKQEEMILVLDDKSLYHSREYIDQCVPLMNYLFMRSKFREIFIISRKSSPSKKKKGYWEAMFIPVKATWHPVVRSNFIWVSSVISSGKTLPLHW